MTLRAETAIPASAYPQSGADRTRLILTLALPIVGGMVSQNILNLVDTAMVGSLGDAALAAVGIGGFANFMATAFVMGFATGVQAMAARRLGQGRVSDTAVPLNGALLLSIAVALPLSAGLVLLVPSIFPYLNPQPDVIVEGIPYLSARLLGMVAVGMNFAFRGYWNGVNRSGLYLRTLLLMHACNVLLNWLLIFGHLGFPAMGAAGAGLGSAISTYVGTAYYMFLGRRYAKESGFMRGLPDRETFVTMVRLATPAGLNQFMMAAGFTAMFWIFGKMGTAETAAASVLINVMLVAILPGLALGLAAASLVGQSLGRGQPDEARRWGWDVVKVAVVGMTVLGLPMILIPDPILAVFLHDPATAALARPALQIFGLMIGVDAIGMVLTNALFGAGASRTVMIVSVTFQWGVFLPAAYVIGPVLGYGLLGIWIAQAAYRVAQTGVFSLLWHRGKWATIRV